MLRDSEERNEKTDNRGVVGIHSERLKKDEEKDRNRDRDRRERMSMEREK